MSRIPSLVLAVSLSLSPVAGAQEAPPPLPTTPATQPLPSSNASPQALTSKASQAAEPGQPEAPSSQEPGTPAALQQQPSSRLPKGFLNQFVHYDTLNQQAYLGSQRRPLTPSEFFTFVGKPELVAKSADLSRQRDILFVSAGAITLVGIATAVVAWSSLPNLNQSFCVANASNYNDICVSEHQTKMVTGTVGLIGGLSVGAMLATLGYWSNPNVYSPDQLLTLASQHNAALLRQLREGTAPNGSHSLRMKVTPYVTPQGAGLLTSMRF